MSLLKPDSNTGDKQTAIIKKPVNEPSSKSKKNSFKLLQSKKNTFRNDFTTADNNSGPVGFLSSMDTKNSSRKASDYIDMDKFKAKSTFPTLFSNKKKKLNNLTDWHENSGYFSIAGTATSTTSKKRTPLNIANFESMSLMSKYNLNVKLEDAFKFTKLLENRTEKSSLDEIRLKFENFSTRKGESESLVLNDFQDLNIASSKHVSNNADKVNTSNTNSNNNPTTNETTQKEKTNFFPSLVPPPPPSVETSLSTNLNNTMKAHTVYNFKHLNEQNDTYF